jgi:hypothetical protein
MKIPFLIRKATSKLKIIKGFKQILNWMQFHFLLSSRIFSIVLKKMNKNKLLTILNKAKKEAA